jgi:hypothetical protein
MGTANINSMRDQIILFMRNKENVDEKGYINPV